MAAAKTLKISLERARGLLVQLGLPTAKRLGEASVLGKLSALDAEDDTADPGKYKRLYAKVCDANANGTDIVIAEGNKTAAQARTRKAKTQKAPAKGRTRTAKKTTGSKKTAAKGRTRKTTAKKKTTAPAGAEKDQYGARIGGNPHKMNELLRKAGKKGLSFQELVDKVGVSLAHANSHVYYMRKKGYVKSVPNKEGRGSRHVIKMKV